MIKKKKKKKSQQHCFKFMSTQNSELRTQKSSSQFSEPQIEYPLGGSSKKSIHVYFLLQVFWVILLYDINVVLMSPW